MNIIPGAGYLDNKKVLLRCDFDVPVVDGKINEKFRIEKQKPVLDFLLKQSSVVMMSHIKAVDSFRDVIKEVESILELKVGLISNLAELSSTVKILQKGQLYLLDNIRNWKGEEDNDESFARSLSTGFDCYINNAFATSHRKHASIAAITKFLPSYAGFLLEEEVDQLDKMIKLPWEGKIFILGGAKTSTKVPVIKNFLDRAQNILIGGVVANDILKEMGIDVGLSVADTDTARLLEGLDIYDSRLALPVDYNMHDRKILDIGPKTIEQYVGIIKHARIIIWNGPVGLAEDDRFSAGTNSIAMAIAGSEALKMIGGGDTIAAVDKLGLLDKFDFVSTGGGAMLEFLAGKKLPGLEVLGYYSN